MLASLKILHSKENKLTCKMSNDDWQTQKFRQNVISKINEMLQANGQDPSKNAGVMENHIFKKSRSKDEYLGLVAKLFVHFKELGRAKQPPPPQNPEMNHQGMMQDPLNALQNLASQGNRNPQMISMSTGPNPNQMGGQVPASNLLLTLNQHRPGQQMHAIRGPMAMNSVGPTGQMVSQINNMQMMSGNAGAGGNVPQSMGGMPGQMNGPIGPGGAAGAQVVGPGVPNAIPNQMHLQNAGSMNVNNMNVQQMQQMNQNQMVNMNHPQISQMMNARLNQANAGVPMNTVNVGPQQQGMVSANMQQNQNGGPGPMHQNGPSMAVAQAGPHGPGNAQVSQVSGQMINIPPNMPHKANMQAAGGQMFAGNRTVAGQQQFLRQSASPVNSQLQQQVQHQQQQQPQVQQQQIQQQSQPRAQTPQQGPGTPQQQQQQPQQSPAQQQTSQAQQNQSAQQQQQSSQQSANSQMIPSPAMGPTPSPQMPSQHIMQGNQRNMSHPSPGGPANNNPGQMNANSPFNPNEEHLYREKYKQLTKYIEPLKHMLDRDRTNSDKMAKMNKLLEILSNPSHRVPLETLLKCEKALEKMELSQIIDTRPSPASAPSSVSGAAQSPAQVPSPAQPSIPTATAAATALSTVAIGKSANPLLEVVTTTMQSPLANHTLYRTFRPCLDILFGTDIVAPKKMRTTPPPPEDNSAQTELRVPYVLQGEVARLDTKFKVKLDQSVKNNSKSMRLTCSLDDKRLPSVPPVNVNIPEEYPMVSPDFSIPANDYAGTTFLKKVQSALMARIAKLPQRHSLTHLLDCWEMSVRQACSPDAKPVFYDLSAIYGV